MIESTRYLGYLEGFPRAALSCLLHRCNVRPCRLNSDEVLPLLGMTSFRFLKWNPQILPQWILVTA